MAAAANEADERSDTQSHSGGLERMIVNGLTGPPGALQGFFLEAGAEFATAFEGVGQPSAGGFDLFVHDFLGGFEQRLGVFDEGQGVMAEGAGSFKVLFGRMAFHLGWVLRSGAAGPMAPDAALCPPDASGGGFNGAQTGQPG
jgi:hypothetical protein